MTRLGPSPFPSIVHNTTRTYPGQHRCRSILLPLPACCVCCDFHVTSCGPGLTFHSLLPLNPSRQLAPFTSFILFGGRRAGSLHRIRRHSSLVTRFCSPTAWALHSLQSSVSPHILVTLSGWLSRLSIPQSQPAFHIGPHTGHLPVVSLTTNSISTSDLLPPSHDSRSHEPRQLRPRLVSTSRLCVPPRPTLAGGASFSPIAVCRISIELL